MGASIGFILGYIVGVAITLWIVLKHPDYLTRDDTKDTDSY